MKTLKQEEIDGRSYPDLRHARRQIGSFIEEVYNRHRLHSALDSRLPLESEVHHATPAIAVVVQMGAVSPCKYRGENNIVRS